MVVPSLSFFNINYKINLGIHTLLNRHLLVNGADSIFLFGTTGEGETFSNNRTEKLKLINLTLNTTGTKTPLLIGVLGNELEEVIDELDDLGKKFESLNFALTPPFKEQKPDLASYFINILDSINIKNPIYILNNPKDFAGNEINPALIRKLLDFENLSGIIDSFDNINNCKSYIPLINEDFSFFCLKEDGFQKFLQLIPLNLRKYCGIVPNISNLVNICSKLYFCAIEDKILELHQIQDQLNDILNKIYDLKIDKGKVQRGLKYAFFYLYRDIIQELPEDYQNLTPELRRELDDITKERIQATVNYLLNQKAIYQLYSLGKEEIYQLDDIINRFSSIDALIKQGKIRKIIGPYPAQTNTIYRVNFEKNQLIFRFRTIKLFKFENIIKEKLLFPLLDGTLNPSDEYFQKKIKEILNIKKGEYYFTKENPPIIPVGNLIYFDENKELIPYMFSVQEYIHGKSLETLYKKYTGENFRFSKSKFLNLFKNIGEILGKLHQIKFNSYQHEVSDLFKDVKMSWSDIFMSDLDAQIHIARKNNFTQENEIKNYFKDHFSLLEDEEEPVLIHNDFQWSNIIIKDDPAKFRLNGVIDFDNWRVGVRAQDFVRMENITFKYVNNHDLKLQFYEGYQNYYKIRNDFYEKVNFYTLFDYLKEFNYAMENRFNADFYRAEINRLLSLNYL